MGGDTDPNAFRSVYILSLPSFEWFEVPFSTVKRRSNLHCQVIGKRQMLVIGGVDPTVDLGSERDPWPKGMGLLDMTELTWSESYNSSAETYTRSNVVQSYTSR